MFRLKMLTRVVVFICIAVHFVPCAFSQQRFGCDETFCTKKVTCPELNCKNGSRIIENATACGCCSICIESLRIGEKCNTRIFAAIPMQECGPGLMCDKKDSVCVPVKTECIEDQRKYDAELRKGKLRFGRTRPECDDFGYYKPIVCISDVLCYCVDKHGQRIHGTVLATNKGIMHCNCSRDFKEFPRYVSADDFLRCLPNGNYDKLQCTGKWCYCMNIQGSSQDIGYVSKANTTLKNLQCYDEHRHREYDLFLRSKCLQDRFKLQQEIEKYESQGITVIGVDLPQCDLDGSYAPVQCKKDRCYCVKRNGDIYEGLNVQRNSKEAREMTCRCAREKEMLHKERNKNENMKLFEKFKCFQNGNYKPNQCVESKSFTLNDMGHQISNENPVDC